MNTTLVETRSGKVQGLQQGAVTVWKGIPFAQPPTGPRRFLPPQPLQSWTGVREALHFGPAAPQRLNAFFSAGTDGATAGATSEDCLYLNIWSPAADDAKRPVMVWIHGGAFIIGAASEPWYDGTSFAANHDLVVVTVDYRLGLLGFSYLAELAGDAYAVSGNCGLLDQIAALRWVRDNIAAFGGDPDNVTVMGESAGAMSVGALLAAPAAKGLFHRAILESGAASNVITREHAAASASAVLTKLGIAASKIAALSEVPTETLLDIQEEISGVEGLGAYAPVVDGVVLPDRPLTLLEQGVAADVPILLGTNRDEWRLFVVLAGGGGGADDEQLRQTFGEAAQTVLATYTNARADQSTEFARMDITSDSVFRIPALHLAEAQVGRGAAVWMYRFDWETPVFGGMLGASHAVEVPFVWNTLDSPLSQLFTGDAPTRQPLADQMHAAWAAFIRDGDPNIVTLPAWPRYDLERRATLIFNSEPRVELDPQRLERLWWEDARQG